MPNQNEIQLLQQIHDKVIDYLMYHDGVVVNPHPTPEDIYKFMNLDLGQPNELEDIRMIIDKYLAYAVRTDSPNFYNQLFSGFSPLGYIGEVIAALTNSSMYTFEMSPIATMIEKKLINKMSKLVGYEKGFGTFVSGGSNSNLVAMLSARHKACPISKTKGLFEQRQLVAFVSEESHYSFVKAGYQIGIGTDQIRKVPCDQTGHMDTIALRSMINNSIANGEKPFFVAATAGTTVRGIFDPINYIADICNDFELWLHIDGSWGGSVILSKSHKHLLDGCERSDSFTWCCHKMMGIPLICTALLLKDKQILKLINEVKGTEYLFHDDDDNELDLGRFSLQCGRKVDSIKLWLTWKYFGDSGYEKKINHLFKLANYSEIKVKKSSILKLISPVESLNICFQPQPAQLHETEWNNFTISVRDKLIHDGHVMVNYAYIGSTCCIRLITVNFEQEKKHLDNFFNIVEETSYKILNKYIS